MQIYFYAESQSSKIYDPGSLGNLGVWAERADLDFPGSPVFKTQLVPPLKAE